MKMPDKCPICNSELNEHTVFVDRQIYVCHPCWDTIVELTNRSIKPKSPKDVCIVQNIVNCNKYSVCGICIKSNIDLFARLVKIQELQ